MDRNSNYGYSKIPFTGSGLAFGTAIGAILGLLVTGDILWAGAGSGVGLVLGAAIDSTKKRK